MEPTFALPRIYELVRRGRIQLRFGAKNWREFHRLGATQSDVEDVLLRLAESDFHKTVPSERRLESMLDVYQPPVGSESRMNAKYLYVKLTIEEGDDPLLVVLSFKNINEEVVW